MSSKVMASFSAFGGDLPSIAFIVLHSLERICPMVQCLHELSPCVSPLFICSSGCSSVTGWARWDLWI